MANRKSRTPKSLCDASNSAVSGAIGRARTRTANRRKSQALPAPSAASLARPAPAPARRARSSLPPLPYGARVSRHGKRAEKPAEDCDVADGVEDDDDDDDRVSDADDGNEMAEDDWEDFQECDAAGAAAVSASLAAAAAEAEARSADAEAAGVSGSLEEVAKAKKAAAVAEAKRRRLATRLRNVQLLNMYKTHIVLLCAMQLRLDAAADDEELQGMALSMLPWDALLKNGDGDRNGMEVLRRFALWFRFTFQPVRLLEGKKMRRKCSVQERAQDCIWKRRGELLDLVVVAAAAIRGMGIRCRIVVPMQAMAFKEAPSARLRKCAGRKIEQVVADRRQLAGLYAWVEVFVGNRWVHCDPVAGLVDLANEKDISQAMCPDSSSATAEPGDRGARAGTGRKAKRQPASALPMPKSRRSVSMAELRKKDTPPVSVKPSIAHVAAVERGVIRDVTRRYVSVWLDVQKERPPSGLFEKTLSVCCLGCGERGRQLSELGKALSTETGGSLTSVFPTDRSGEPLFSTSASSRISDLEDSSFRVSTFTGKAADNKGDIAATSEQLEFDRRAMKEAVPKTLSALRSHQLYVVERHLRKYEVIYPKEPVLGYVGREREPVYLRSHVRMLHTRDRWNREMRSVNENELPIKTVATKSKRDRDGVPIPSDSNLFGEWQTGPLVVAPVKDGVVPRNERGNVDLWTPAHMPKGGVHISLAHAANVARQLGFDYAPCMTGFDVRSGRSVPRIEGIVIAAEYEEVVRDAALAAGQRAMERAEARAKEEALGRWKDLFRSMKERLRVQQKYGGVLDDSVEGTCESILKGHRKEPGQTGSVGKGSAAGPSPMFAGRTRVDGAAETGGEPEEKRPRLATAAAGSHEHDFDARRHHEGDIWIKTCSICGIEVPYEKL